jgi:HlyD family secretion protein
MKDYDLASANAQLASAKISLDKALYSVEQATLKSPIDGEVALLNYKAGDIIDKNNASDPVIKIINTNTLFIEVNVEEGDINDLVVGQKAVATFDSSDGIELNGEVSYISLISATSGNGIVTYLVRIIFEKPEGVVIREGMTASIEFIVKEAEQVLTIPVGAVRNIDGKPSVELVGGEIRSVATGFTDGKYVEVISGLSEGEKIQY